MKPPVLKFQQDKTRKLDDFFEKVRNKYFSEMSYARINYIFRTVAKTDDEGMLVLGQARKLTNRERDLYGYDFEICVHKKSWLGFNNKDKERLAWHELNHCVVKLQPDGQPKLDKAKRIAIGLRRHDIVIRTFMKEIKKYGPTKSEAIVIRKIQEYKDEKRVIKRR